MPTTIFTFSLKGTNFNKLKVCETKQKISDINFACYKIKCFIKIGEPKTFFVADVAHSWALADSNCISEKLC